MSAELLEDQDKAANDATSIGQQDEEGQDASREEAEPAEAPDAEEAFTGRGKILSRIFTVQGHHLSRQIGGRLSLDCSTGCAARQTLRCGLKLLNSSALTALIWVAAGKRKLWPGLLIFWMSSALTRLDVLDTSYVSSH